MRTMAPSLRPLKNSKAGLSLKQLTVNEPVLSPSSTARKGLPVLVGRSARRLINSTLAKVSPPLGSRFLTSRTARVVEMSAMVTEDREQKTEDRAKTVQPYFLTSLV